MAKNVIALPGAENPEDAAKFIMEASASGRLKGVVVGIVTQGDVEGETEVATTVCGLISCGDMVWISHRVSCMASHDTSEDEDGGE